MLIYRPHHIYHNKLALHEETKENNNQLCNIIRHLPKPCILIGDFNYSCIDWHTLSASAASSAFLDATQDSFYTQHVNFVTRHISGTTPDLILSSSPELVAGVEDMGRLGVSDHTMIIISVVGKLPNNTTFELVPDWHCADMEKFRTELVAIDWVDCLVGLNTVDS